MVVNRLPCIEDYWSNDRFMVNKAIQNVMKRSIFQAILQNVHFGDKQRKDESDKGFKIRPVIEHFNPTFASVLGNQSID